jgi:ATP-binding cassette subfamily F protein uup
MDKVVDHIFVFNGNGDIKDFPGNYTDWRDWREEEKANAAKQALEKASKSTAVKQSYRTETKRKLTFKERKEYESLEEEIMLLEEEKAAIEQEMSSGTLDNDTLLKRSVRIQEVIALIDDKSMRWLELSEFA